MIDQGVATRERDQLLGVIQSQTQLLRSAITLQRWAAERPKPDAQRETGYQQRDEVLITGQLKQVQRRYAPAIEKALLTDLLTQYQALPAAQHVAEFDAVFGTTPAQLKTRLDALYAGTAPRRRSAATGRDEVRPRHAGAVERHAAQGRGDAAAGDPAPGRGDQDQRRRTAAPASGLHARADRLPQVAGTRGLSGCQLHAARELRPDQRDGSARWRALPAADHGAGHRREAHRRGAVRRAAAAARCDRQGRFRQHRRAEPEARRPSTS